MKQAQRYTDRPVFIVGSARSGTVLMGQILKKHPNVHCLIEFPSVFNFASRIALRPSLKVEEATWVCSKLRELYQAAWRTTFWHCGGCSSICKNSSARSGIIGKSCVRNKSIMCYADKSHQHILNIPVLLKAFPDAKFIHLIRDGRDVVASMLRHNGVLSWFSKEYINASSEWPQPWFGVTNEEHFKQWLNQTLAYKCALRWKSWIDVGMTASRDVSRNQWFDVRYEELVTDPLGIATSLFQFLGLDMCESTVSHVKRTSVDNWKRRLSSEDLDDILKVAESTLEKLGYAF